MQPTLDFVSDNISPTMLRYVEVTKRSMREVLLRAGRGVHRRVMAITPPASEGMGSTLGRSAYDQGKQAIHRDLSRVLAPRTLKHKRREQHPDIEATYRARRRLRVNGLGATSRRGPVAFVDRNKFLAFERKLQGRIGALAGGWNPGALALGVPVPAWVARHGGSRGTAKVRLITTDMGITVTNLAPGLPSNLRSELARRIPYAVRYQDAAMRREIDYLVFKNAQALAIKTRNFTGLVPAGMQGAA